MYPDRGKTALAGKELQLLRELTGGDPDADTLLADANARRRIVVKRPRSAAPLAGRAPSLALTGTQARFDIYLVTPR
jgi:16S rRNA (guanine1516-N2)-methyltransferase